MHLKLKLGPTAQRAFAVVSWGIALGCAVAVRMHGPLGLREQGSAPALPRAMHLDLAASIVAWTAFHFKVSKTFGRLYGNGLNSRGFAAWTYYTSFVNGLLVQPFLLLHAARAYALSGEPDRSIEGFLRQPWLDGRGEVRACTAPLEQVLCCIMGYVLREYSSLHPDGLQLPYNVHHLICVVGCSHHLVTPGGVGLMALNAVQVQGGTGHGTRGPARTSRPKARWPAPLRGGPPLPSTPLPHTYNNTVTYNNAVTFRTHTSPYLLPLASYWLRSARPPLHSTRCAATDQTSSRRWCTA